MIVATQNPSCPESLNPEIPLSLFKSVLDTGSRGFYHDINRTVSWDDFTDLLETYFGCEFRRKEDAPLFSPTVYKLIPRGKTNGFRCQENSTLSGTGIIDADGGLQFDDVLARLSEYEIEAVCYTTASNNSGERFRIVIPFADPVDPPTQKRAIEAICRFLAPGWKADTTKNNCYSLFYLPGHYQGAENRFVHLKGAILPASAWFEIGKIDEPCDPTPDIAHRALKPIHTAWNSVGECPYVNAKWIESYLSVLDGSYNALYAFMVKVALAATRRGIFLTPAQLADLARDLERMSDRQHASWDIATRPLDEEAEHALAFAATKSNEPPKTPNVLHAGMHSVEQSTHIDEADASRQSRQSRPSGEAQMPYETSLTSLPTDSAGGCENQCAVDLGLPSIAPLAGVRPYRFEDLAFAGRDGAEPNRAFQYLAQRCVAIGGEIWLRRGRYWQAHKKMFALPMLKQQYITVKQDQSEPVIVTADIENFVRNAVPTLVGKGVFPGAPEFVLFDGLPYLNLWVDDRIRSDIDHIDRSEIILRLIHDVLCALPPVSFDEMLTEIAEKSTSFAWVIHWIASLYIRPGHHIGTALWLVGEQGFGKGTLVEIIRRLIGPQSVGKASPDELERRWSDFFVGKTVIEWDEYTMDSRNEMEVRFKKLLGNRIVEVSGRHVGKFEILNIINHILTTNNLHPVRLTPDDRRHTIIRSAKDARLKAISRQYHLLDEHEKVEALTGFAALLSVVEIDPQFISNVYETDYRHELISWSVSSIERWFGAQDEDWWVGQERSSHDLFATFFLNWAKSYDPQAAQQIKNQMTFGKEMSRLVDAGYIERVKDTRGNSVYRKVRYYYPETEAAVKPQQEEWQSTREMLQKIKHNAEGSASRQACSAV